MVSKMEKIVIFGYGGHGRSIADSIISQGKYEIAGYIDVKDKHVDNLPYLGQDNQLESVFESGIHEAVLGIGFMGNSDVRDKVYETANRIGFHFPPIIDATAVIAKDAIIDEGVFVGKRAIVNARAQVGKMSIVNTGAIVEHDNRIGAFSHVAVGTTLCGDVAVGDHCLIGANATVIQGVKIGSYAIIGAGTVVISDVIDYETVVGVPARNVRKHQ